MQDLSELETAAAFNAYHWSIINWYSKGGAVLVMCTVIGLLLSCYSWLSICYRGAGAGGDRRDGVGQDDADGAVPTTVQSPNELLRARRCWW